MTLHAKVRNVTVTWPPEPPRLGFPEHHLPQFIAPLGGIKPGSGREKTEHPICFPFV